MSGEVLPPWYERLAAWLRRVAERVSLGRGRLRDEQQLLSVVDQAAEQDLLQDDDRDYIHSIVEFGDTLVRAVMVPRTDMVTVDADTSVRETLELLLSSRHSRLPVIGDDADQVLGVVYLRDASKFMLRHAADDSCTPVTRIMKPAMFVPEVQRADRLLRLMQQESNHLALVVDEYGGISGLATLEDLIEELLGDISDEHDREIVEVLAESPDSYVVSARLPIDDLGALFAVEIDDEEVDTVGGLFAKWLGRLPEPGDSVSGCGILLEAIDIERRKQRLISARATRAPLAEVEDSAQTPIKEQL